MFGHRVTESIYHDASSLVMKSRLESLPNIHQVSVNRQGPDQVNGYTWRITFYVTKGTPLHLLQHYQPPAVLQNLQLSLLKTSCQRKTTLGTICLFPFTYLNTVYTDCAPLGNNENKNEKDSGKLFKATQEQCSCNYRQNS